MIARLDEADRQRLSRVLALFDSPVEGAILRGGPA